MKNAGIMDGDYVIVHPSPEARDGEIVVALLGDEDATVKRFYKETDHFRLERTNETMSPIITTDAQVMGKVIGSFRRSRHGGPTLKGAAGFKTCRGRKPAPWKSRGLVKGGASGIRGNSRRELSANSALRLRSARRFEIGVECAMHQSGLSRIASREDHGSRGVGWGPPGFV